MKLKPLFIALITTTMLASCVSTQDLERQQSIDSSITKNVQNVVTLDANLRPYSIQVETVNGNVRLSGTVDTHDEAARVENKALAIKGVRTVENDLVVRKRVSEPKASAESVRRETRDSNLTNAVKTALLKKADISSVHIEVNTQNSIVSLDGSVPTLAESSRAERVAKSIKGVVRVENNLAVQ